jgi:type II secretory pathway component GspD/PulD (secretin)
MRTSIIASTLIAAIAAGPLSAQTQDTPTAPMEMPTAPVAPLEDNPEPEEATDPTVVIADVDTASSMARGSDTLSVDFPDEEIRNILRNVADLFELNLVIPDTLQGNTSIKLRDVTWRQIFEVVLNPVGYTFVEEGNIIKVVSQESLLQEPVTTDVFIINYALAEDIRGSVEPLIETTVGGRIVVNTRSNALIITERPSRLSKIRPIIEALDKATDQVMIESKFIEVTDRDVSDIGVNWASLSGYELGVGNLSRTYDSSGGNTYNNDTTNEIINGSGRLGERVATTDSLNERTNASDTSLSSSVSNTGGVTTSQSDSTLSSSILNSIEDTVSLTDTNTDTNEVSNTLTQLNNLIGLGGTTRTDSAVFSASQFSLILSALESQNDTKLVSNPTVVTLNNTEAQINVGSEYPIPNYTYNAERGTFEVSGFEYRPVGIILKVTPQVNAQGFIKLNVEPEVSSQNGFTSFGGAGGAEIPIIATRKAVTQVSLRDGYTMGIGGLVESDALNGETRVPVLGSIPGLGRLFRSNSMNETRRNLLIFITAKTVSAEGAPPEELFDPRQIRDMNLRRSDLPGYREPGEDPFLSEDSEDQAE